MQAQRTSFVIQPLVLQKLDEYAEHNGMTRSAAINMAITQFLENREMIDKLPSLLKETNELLARAEKLKKKR